MADEDLPPEGEEAGDILAPEIEQEEAPETDAPNIDDLAAEMGWTPKDKWRGDPDKWKPAPDFLRTTVDVNRGLKEKLDGVERQVSQMARTSAQLTERAVAQEREKLLKERNEAFELSDADAFNKADEKLSQLAQQRPQAPPPPETQEFAERNANWFGKDQEATAWAVNRSNELAAQGLGVARQLATVEREVRQLFPDHFETTTAKSAPLTKPGARGAAPSRKSFSTLPAEVQKAALSYEKRGTCNREEYAKIYYEEEA